eukprot:scaffold24_cov245-Pinguiococcus_pyrenoidosus.AAC.30
MQVAASAVGASGLVAGVDLEPVEPLGQPNVHTEVGDFTDPAVQREVRQLLGGRPVNVILSDMAPVSRLPWRPRRKRTAMRKTLLLNP